MKAFAKRMRILLAAGALALVFAVVPLLSQVLSGERTELAASAGAASVEVYHIKNVTKNKRYVVNEKNFARLADTIVYYDSVWADKHEGGTDQNEWGAEVKVELEDGKYVVKEIVADNIGKNMAIPEDGFVLSGNGTGKTALLEFEEGDELEFTSTARFITVNQTKGLEVVVNAKNQDPADCANVWTSAYGKSTPSVSWRNRIICEKAEGENLYKVKTKQDQSATPITAEIPDGGIVIDTHSNNYTVQKGCFYASTEVDDIIYFEDTVDLEPANITVKSGDFELAVDGINPTIDQKIAKGSLIYTNMSSGYMTLPREDETVKEYVVEKKDGAWEVTSVEEAGETAIPDYDGFVLSIPSTVTGYDALNEGDKITLEGKFDQNTAFAVNVGSNRRIVIDAANLKTRSADTLVIYDDTEFLADAQEGYDEPVKGYTGTNENGVEIQVTKQDGKYVVTQKTNLGEVGNLQIPEDGFVLSGHGTKASVVDMFNIDDEVLVFDKSILSNSTLTSIIINESPLAGFDPDTMQYDVVVDESETAAPVVEGTVQTRMGQAPSVEVTGIETAKGTVTIKVTALDGTINTYSVKFDRAYGTDTSLSSVTVGGVAITGIKVNMTYAVKPGELPEVAATATDSRATVTITQATAENKVATIKVVADDVSFNRTYKITFVDADTSLASITVGGVALENFSAGTFSYTHTLAAGTTEVPTVAATATDSNTTVSVEQAEGITGTATITVTIDGASSVYTVKFDVAEDVGGGNGNGETGDGSGETDDNGGSNVGMIVGIVVGAVAVVAAAGVAVFFVMKKKGKNK